VEGVGGFRVPLNEVEDSADLAQQFNLPVILVVGMRLGCINQTLLNVEAITARGLRLAGWVANCAQGEMDFLEQNLAAIRVRLPAPCLGCIPHLIKPSVTDALRYLDLTPLLHEKKSVN
jgi:dethiobiotin synthetase